MSSLITIIKKVDGVHFLLDPTSELNKQTKYRESNNRSKFFKQLGVGAASKALKIEGIWPHIELFFGDVRPFLNLANTSPMREFKYLSSLMNLLFRYEPG